jgi:hypothetical protein
VRLLAAQLAQHVEAAPSRHLLVQQHQVVRLPAGERERVIAVRRGVDLVALLTEEEEVGLEKLDLVVDPQNSFLRRLHGPRIALGRNAKGLLHPRFRFGGR